jgi:hypothetical protein
LVHILSVELRLGIAVIAVTPVSAGALAVTATIKETVRQGPLFHHASMLWYLTTTACK